MIIDTKLKTRKKIINIESKIETLYQSLVQIDNY